MFRLPLCRCPTRLDSPLSGLAVPLRIGLLRSLFFPVQGRWYRKSLVPAKVDPPGTPLRKPPHLRNKSQSWYFFSLGPLAILTQSQKFTGFLLKVLQRDLRFFQCPFPFLFFLFLPIRFFFRPHSFLDYSVLFWNYSPRLSTPTQGVFPIFFCRL